MADALGARLSPCGSRAGGNQPAGLQHTKVSPKLKPTLSILCLGTVAWDIDVLQLKL